MGILPPEVIANIRASVPCRSRDAAAFALDCAQGTFIDLGANKGDSLVAFLTSTAQKGLFSPVLSVFTVDILLDEL